MARKTRLEECRLEECTGRLAVVEEGLDLLALAGMPAEGEYEYTG